MCSDYSHKSRLIEIETGRYGCSPTLKLVANGSYVMWRECRAEAHTELENSVALARTQE